MSQWKSEMRKNRGEKQNYKEKINMKCQQERRGEVTVFKERKGKATYKKPQWLLYLLFAVNDACQLQQKKDRKVVHVILPTTSHDPGSV